MNLLLFILHLRVRQAHTSHSTDQRPIYDFMIQCELHLQDAYFLSLCAHCCSFVKKVLLIVNAPIIKRRLHRYHF